MWHISKDMIEILSIQIPRSRKREKRRQEKFYYRNGTEYAYKIDMLSDRTELKKIVSKTRAHATKLRQRNIQHNRDLNKRLMIYDD